MQDELHAAAGNVIKYGALVYLKKGNPKFRES